MARHEESRQRSPQQVSYLNGPFYVHPSTEEGAFRSPIKIQIETPDGGNVSLLVAIIENRSAAAGNNKGGLYDIIKKLPGGDHGECSLHVAFFGGNRTKLGNRRKFSDYQDRIPIQLTGTYSCNIRQLYILGKGEVRIAVTDSGSGIATMYVFRVPNKFLRTVGTENIKRGREGDVAYAIMGAMASTPDVFKIPISPTYQFYLASWLS